MIALFWSDESDEDEFDYLIPVSNQEKKEPTIDTEQQPSASEELFDDGKIH